MLLLNGKPVADNFFESYATSMKVSKESLFVKETKKFRLTEAFFRRIRQREMKSGQTQERILVAPEYHIEPSIKWVNPTTGMTDILTYTTNFLPDQNGRNQAYVEPITFEYGWLTVLSGQNDLYFILNQHTLNKTNPKYADPSQKPNKPFTFTEVLPDKEANDFVDYERKVASIITILTDKDHRKYVNDEAVTSLAKSYGFGSVQGKGRNDVNKFLIEHAKKTPDKLLTDLTSATTEIRAVLSDAIAYGIIKKDLPYIKWVNLEKGKRTVNNGIICQVASGLEPMDYFVNWMREKDNSGVYNQLKKELDEKKLAEVESQTIEITV